LDEISNDITKYTPACFEPTIDYCVVKFPRFAFDKFPQANQTLTTQMKSVGEVMAIGRTFKEALQKSIRSLEIDRYGLESYLPKLSAEEKADFPAQVRQKLQVPNWERLWYLADALRLGMSMDEIFNLTRIDPWFIENIRQLVEFEGKIRSAAELTPDFLRQTKQMGFADKYIAQLRGITEKEVRNLREKQGLRAVFKTVDTCAAEFKAYTPYLYSTYEQECEANPTARKKYMILGSGPNRIGQGVEFDYCCVQAAFALRDQGFETIMVNCNPETVSTDYDTSDRLYFEPLTVEDILAIIAVEKPDGIIVQLGGQTPLKLSVPLEKEGVKIIGTSPDNIDRAEDRERFKEVLDKLQLRQPESGIARSYEDAEKVAARIGYPVLVRPSYVLGGRAMEIVYDNASLANYMQRALTVSPGHPILIDKYLEKAIEVDVDAVSDGSETIVAGIMQHIEEAGIHSGDSACSLPPYSLDAQIVNEIKRQAKLLAKELNVIGLINIQFAVKDRDVYILEVNPRGSRTVPFVSKAVGLPLAKIGALVMTGMSLKELGVTEPVATKHIAVKEAVFPFIKFPGVDTVLGPEMRSTGEVMGIDDNFAMAFAKAQNSIGLNLPLSGTAFLSVRDEDKADLVAIAASLQKSGFQLLATHGTYQYLKERGITVSPVNKVSEGRPHIEDNIKSGKIALLVNTAGDKRTRQESYSLRRAALVYNVPYFTTIAGACATAQAIRALQEEKMQVKPLQEYHVEMR
ncbi:MAG: carbamoyl-phosphate synthase large subunit, partial [Candidatus Schekmanbacteria bacterium]|nr:carbamoyl-phosphate synthase large subunit [Candidatus Schekmanbacteria bacterium]